MGFAVLDLWPKICQNKSFGHFPLLHNHELCSMHHLFYVHLNSLKTITIFIVRLPRHTFPLKNLISFSRWNLLILIKNLFALWSVDASIKHHYHNYIACSHTCAVHLRMMSYPVCRLRKIGHIHPRSSTWISQEIEVFKDENFAHFVSLIFLFRPSYRITEKTKKYIEMAWSWNRWFP